MVSSSNHHERIKIQFVEMGLVSLVLNMLTDGEKHLNEIALGFFDRILDSKEGREAACGNDLTMPVLVKKILRVSELATEHSVSSIWKLSRFEKQSNERRVLFEALQVGVFQKLVVLLQCGCGDSTKEKATQLLKLLNPYRSGLECIESSDFKNLKRQQHGLGPYLAKLLESLKALLELKSNFKGCIHPEESFAKVKKYGLPMLLTQDEGVKSFIANLTAQLTEWLESGKLIETDSEVVERVSQGRRVTKK
ncbi:hypothetical protein LWI29_024714 [Acer saccharum]|uniref:U-box domain-containing protein n=1 Tax=Acer saccharum TaxID=4024 RepID=A0AA39VP54_ACESA|nr:hypothetical protein LWI29_024714 [Acer saccharum]